MFKFLIEVAFVRNQAETCLTFPSVLFGPVFEKNSMLLNRPEQMEYG